MLAIWGEDFRVAETVLANLNYEVMRNALATAIAEQRERSAAIAEGYRPGDPMARGIAEAIRKNRTES